MYNYDVSSTCVAVAVRWQQKYFISSCHPGQMTSLLFYWGGSNGGTKCSQPKSHQSGLRIHFEHLCGYVRPEVCLVPTKENTLKHQS
jgi:hypothetical protein